jgi:CelD/BcsL family acetyltransferase involved in cellulose biosynthesis
VKLIVFDSFCTELEKLWKELEPVSQHHVFQSHEWLKFWQNTIGDRTLRGVPWIAAVLDMDDQPRMIFPFGIRRHFGVRVLEFLGGGQADYQGPLIHNGWISDISNVESAWNLVCNALPRHDIRHLVKLPAQWCAEDNPMLRILKCKFQDSSYSSRLPEDVNKFQLRLRPKLKADTHRQRRRLSELGTVKFEVIDKNDTWLAALDVMIEQKRQRYRSTGVPDMFSDKAVQQFYRELPKRFAEEGRIHFSIVRLDDEILSTHWGAIYRDRFYFLLPTYESEKWGPYSPGRLLLSNLIEWCIQNGLKVFDFTIGGEDYKKDWCNSEMPLFEHLHIVTPIGLPYLSYILLRRRARRSTRVWSSITLIYSWLQYGKRNGNKF